MPLVFHIEELDERLYKTPWIDKHIGAVEPYKKALFGETWFRRKTHGKYHVHVVLWNKEPRVWTHEELEELFGVHGNYKMVTETPFKAIWYTSKLHSTASLLGDHRFHLIAHSDYCTDDWNCLFMEPQIKQNLVAGNPMANALKAASPNITSQLKRAKHAKSAKRDYRSLVKGD